VAEAAEKAYASGGGGDMLRTLQEKQKKLYDRGSLSPYPLALTDSLLGNKPEALRYLKIAYDQHDDNLVLVSSERGFDSLHNDPAYKELMARFTFPDVR
jgi:hypothetical protein